MLGCSSRRSITDIILDINIILDQDKTLDIDIVLGICSQ